VGSIYDAVSYAAARQCEIFIGDLTVDPAFAGPLLELPLLRAVGGTFQLSSNAQVTSVSMPLLSSIGGDLLVQSNERLTTLELPQIVSVSLSLIVTGNAQLETLSSFYFFSRAFPRLATVGLDLFITDNSLPCVDFLALTSAGRNVLVEVDGLTGTCDALACLQGGCFFWEAVGQLSCLCQGDVSPALPPSPPPPSPPASPPPPPSPPKSPIFTPQAPPPQPPSPPLAPPPKLPPGILCYESQTIFDAISYASARSCELILGNLTVSPAFAGPLLDLPLLEQVYDSVRVDANAQLTSVSMPLLRTISFELTVQGNGQLNALDLPELSFVGSSIVVTRNAQLATLSSKPSFPTTFPQLYRVGLDLYITENGLPCIDLPALNSVGRDVLVSVGTGTCDTLACLQTGCIAYEAISQLSCECGDPAFPALPPSPPPSSPPPASPSPPPSPPESPIFTPPPSTPPFAPPPATPPTAPPSVPASPSPPPSPPESPIFTPPPSTPPFAPPPATPPTAPPSVPAWVAAARAAVATAAVQAPPG